ncbi:MAG: hypothetical protein U0133_12475 [Gemmatimonadales bacterium]
MRPARTRVGRLVPALGCLLLGVSSGPLLAQERTTADTISWGSVGTRAGWCVEFLMEPKAAAEDLTRGYRVSAARESRTLLPAIARLISEEPTYADWVPSQLCLYLADGITLQNRRYDRGDAGQPIAVIYWSVSAAREDGADAGSGLVSFRSFGTNSSSLQQRMGNLGVPVDRIQLEVRPMSDSPDLNYIIKLSGAQVFYSTGAPRPDSTRAATPLAATGVFNGNNRAVWTARLNYDPEALGHTSGALRVVGKRGLAKALNRSPIRLVGPAIIGGSGTVTLTR